ncbi:hypothetical protein [Limosilactobacillus reuteri]|uniref:hypothetical protein n=1 Tax=Limosilactobacillus reuteri TaxID=1598 RepID=UPI00266F5F26|nr:hypothetical protein [Limosilactobacillus reuteri]
MRKEEATIKLFKAVVEDKFSNPRATETGLLLDALKKGVLINPCVLDGRTEEQQKSVVKSAVWEYGVDAEKVNSTFYKRFSDVEGRSELQLRFEQLAHYMSTYGRGIDRDDIEIYEPEFLNGLHIDINDELVYIDAITEAELAKKVKNMLTSGIALSSEDQVLISEIIDGYHLTIDYVDQIKNREYMCHVCEELMLLPKNFDEFTRYLIYLATDNTLLIKSRDMINRLGHLSDSWSSDQNYMVLEKTFERYVKSFGIEEAAKHITRYRKLYLVLRKHFEDKTLINRALHLSKRMYEPRKQSPLEHVMDYDVEFSDIERAMFKAPIYKLIKLDNALLRMYGTQKARYFKIRNGKTYLKVMNNKDSVNELRRTLRSEKLHNMILDVLKHRYGNWRNKVFYIPEGVEYAVPTTAKDFIGELPYMTTYDFEGKNVSLGIAWDEHQADLDLHMMSLGGHHYGWNGSYQGEVTYSGDMTHLNQYGHAAEFYKVSANTIKDPFAVTVNDYYSSSEVKFDVFVTGANIDTDAKQGVATQIGDKSVLFHNKVSNDDKSKTLMLVIPTKNGFKIAFTGDSYGNQQVPGVDNSTKLLLEILKNQVEQQFTVNDLIKLLGGKIISSQNDLEMLKEDIAKSAKVEGTFTGANKQLYTKVSVTTPEIINLSPSKVTASTFIDLLKEPEEDK